MSSPLTSSNRLNIPAVCRIRKSATGATTGTGVLVAPGIILTSRFAVGECREEAATLTATFFEGTKKRVADVKLLPDKYFFTAVYPDYMDYCLVACEEGPLLNVIPIHLPLVQSEWTAVCEGDVVLVVQHPIAVDSADEVNVSETEESDAENGQQDMANEHSVLEQRRFEEVLRCRENLYYLKTNGLALTAGCPAFNDLGNLIGLQCQRQGSDGDGMVSRILSIVSIVKHLFAMKQLAILPQQHLVGPPAFDNIWSTWFTEKDITRVYTILSNFRGKETVREVTRRLCEMTAKPNSGIDAQEDAGAINIILSNLAVFPDDEKLAELGLRALWNVSVGSHAVLNTIAQENGVQAVVTLMERFPHNEEIVQFGAVMLCNMADAGVEIFSQESVGERLFDVLFAATKAFKESLVLQKYSFAMLTRLLRWQHATPPSPTQQQKVVSAGVSSAPTRSSSFALHLVQQGMLEHAGFLLHRFSQGQVFLIERVLELVAELAQDRKAIECSRGPFSVSSTDIQSPTAANGCGTLPKPSYITAHLIDTLVEVMQHNVGNDTIMVEGNAALWGLGNVPEYRAAILLNPQSQEVLRLSVPSLMASST